MRSLQAQVIVPGQIAATAFDLGVNAMVDGALPEAVPKQASYAVAFGGPGVRADAPMVPTVECANCPGGNGNAIAAVNTNEFYSYTVFSPVAGKQIISLAVSSASAVPDGNRAVVMVGRGQCIERAAPYACNPALEPVATAAFDQTFTGTGGMEVSHPTDVRG
jgi:hypothetical protein